MHIGFDARPLSEGGTGDRTYFRELIAAMAKLEPENRYTLYYREEDEDRETFAAHSPSVHTKKIVFPIGWLWSQLAVAPQLKRDSVDVFHAQYLLPPRTKCPAVVTIHDITFHLFPEWTPPRARRLMNFLIPL